VFGLAWVDLVVQVADAAHNQPVDALRNSPHVQEVDTGRSVIRVNNLIEIDYF
jgi:hypothetical protein